MKAYLPLLLLHTCALVRAVEVYTEEELYQSKLWKNRSSILIIHTQGRESHDAVPEQYLSSLDEHIKNNSLTITQIKVTCGSEAVSHGVVCEALSTHQLVVRKKGDTVEGMEFSTEGELLSAVMTYLLGDSLSMLSSYSEFKEYTKRHSHYLLVLIDNTSSADFINFLVSLLNYHTPVAVVTNVICLPLARRPHFNVRNPTLSIFHLWIIVGEEWIKQYEIPNQDMLRRLQYPIIKRDFREKKDLSFSDAQLHSVFAFPASKGTSDVDFDAIILNIALRTFMDYVFVKVDRKRYSNLAKRLYVTGDASYHELIILPYGDINELMSVEIKGQDITGEIDMAVRTLDSLSRFHPWSRNKRRANVSQKPTVTDASKLATIEKKVQHSVIAIFCKIDEKPCIDRGSSKLKSAITGIRKAKVGIEVLGFIIKCHSVKDLKKSKTQINSLPSYALFNVTQRKWYAEIGEVGSPNDIIALVAKTTGISDLKDKALLEPEPPPIPPLLQEEDHFGLLFRTLPRVSLPEELILTNTNFDSTVTQHQKTAVVFYIRWDVRSRVFLHHVMAAWERLDKSLSVVLGVVNCEDYTGICYRYGVTSFPTVLLFTPSTLHTPAPLTPSPTTLSSQQILLTLGQISTTDKNALVELTPSTLPGALRGTLDTPLILWCDSHVTEEFDVFSEVSEIEDFNGMTFAWINSSKYGEILSGLLANKDVTYPTVVALKLNLQSVYHLPISDGFREEMMTFLTHIEDGSLQPTHELPSKSWSPLKPPIKFPSKRRPPKPTQNQQAHKTQSHTPHVHNEL